MNYNPTTWYQPPENQIFHLIYLTKNLKNNKIYIGKHSTYNLADGYLGSGDKLKVAIKKYGRKNFERLILHFCISSEDALEIEKRIVDDNFIKRRDTYNVTIGGYGSSLSSYNSNKKGKTIEEILGVERGKQYRETRSMCAKIGMASPEYNNRTWEEKFGVEKANALKAEKSEIMIEQNKNRIFSDETKAKMSIANKGTYIEKYGIDRAAEIRNKIGKAQIGNKHSKDTIAKRLKTFKNNAKLCIEYTIISPDAECFICRTGLKDFCLQHNLSYQLMKTWINKGIIHPSLMRTEKCKNTEY